MEQIDISRMTSRRQSEQFPNFIISKPNDTIPVIIGSLEKGDCQLIIEFAGQRKVAANISLSAYNVDRLIRCTGSLIYRKNRDVYYVLNSVTDYLEVV